jgi:hypothetical protein
MRACGNKGTWLAAIVEPFKALPDINYQPVRMLRNQEGL